MDKYKISDILEIELKATGKKTTMHWKGSIDSNNDNDVLEKHLLDFHNKCKEQGIEELYVDFCQVDFMNSSGIKNVISWLRDISRDNQYKTTILFDPSVTWQDVTFETFRQLLHNVKLKRK